MAGRRQRRADRPRWSSWTKRNSAASRVRSPCPCRPGPGAGRCGRHREVRPAGARPRPEDDHLGRGAAAALLGLASWASGDLEAAHRRMPLAWRVCSGPGTSPTYIGGAIALADIRIAQGRLREAMRTYEQALQLATEQGEPAAAGNGGHVRRHERAPPRARRSAMPPRSTC